MIDYLQIPNLIVILYLVYNLGSFKISKMAKITL